MQSLGKSVLVVRCQVPCRARQQRLVAAEIAVCQGRRWSRRPVPEHQADLDRVCARRVLASLLTRAIFRLVFSV